MATVREDIMAIKDTSLSAQLYSHTVAESLVGFRMATKADAKPREPMARLRGRGSRSRPPGC
jgi:hypothetical protein